MTSRGVTAFAAEIQRRGITQAKAAELLDSDPPTISKILNEVRQPTLQMAASIEAVFGVPASWFVPLRRTRRKAA
jgi:transcriptional regulator with XRE-family HTH domain